MIDFDNWSPFLKLSFLIAPFGLGLLGIAINVQIALSRDFHVAMSAITSNPYLEQMKPVWGGGSLRSRCLLLSTVSGLVTFPGLHLRMGWLDEVELKNFPPKIKRKLGAALWLIMISSVWVGVGYFMIKK
jgi:ABC-type sugar transport system permease subunit